MKLRKFLAVVLSIAMVLSSMSFTVLADDPALPNAEVKNLGAITIDEYSIWDGSLSEGGDPIDLQIAMEFIAKDTEEEAVANFYGNYTTDFFIKMEGMANGNFTADGCYLAGNYGTFGWIQIPLDGMLVEEGVIYPVITSVGFDFKYTDICSAVKDFKCGIYLSETVIEENPDLKVNLTLGLSEDIDTAKAGQYTTVDSYTYPVADFNKVVELYRASVMARSGGLVYVDSYESLEEALAAAEDGDTIKVIKSFEVKNQVSVEKDITLDLNGCIINGAMASGSETNHIYALANKAEMIIMDSVGTGSIDSRGIYNYGNLTLESGTINAIDGNGGYAVYNQNGSTFVMNGGVIAATYEDDHQSVNGGYDATALYVPADSTATLNGGKIVNVCDFTFAVYTAGTLNIPDDSTIEIIGTHGAITVQGGTTTIDAGTFTIPADEYVRTDNVIYVSGGSIVINGGTFVGDSDTTSGGSCIYDEAGSATINGGSFSGSSGGDVWGTTGTVITGGSFENLTETQHIADGFKLGENGAIIVDRTGSVTPCYTAPGKYWGEARSNSEESFVIELYEEDTKIASASLNNIGGIIDGDVYVTWHLDFSPVEDSYWNVEWAEGYPKYDMNPTAVKLFADGVEVAENNVQYNAPDNLNKIVALAEGYTGGVVAYTSLVEAVGNFNGRKVNVLRDVTEEIKELNGCTLTTNVEGGVTVTSTYSDYIYAGDFNIGKGVTVKSTKFFTFDDVLNTIEGTLIVGEGESGTFYHGYNAKTEVKNGGKIVANGTTILRYNENADAGIYVYGDGDDSTIEYDCAYYIGSYSGTFYAENANVEAGYYLLKNSYDNEDYADMFVTLDNSSITVVGTTDTQDSFVIDDKAHLTLKNGSAIKDVRDFNILTGATPVISIDNTSSFEATNISVANDVKLSVEKNADGTLKIENKINGTGTAEDPYLIANLEDLKGFRDNVNNGNSYAGKYVELTADIDLNGEDWTPIGTSVNPFNGNFNGNDKTISNLVINGDKTYVSGGNNDNYKGLFGYSKGNKTVIENVKIHNAKVTGCLYVGALIGRIYTGATIKNCYVTGEIDIDSYSYAGVIAGRYDYGSGIFNCSVKDETSNGGTVNADYAVSYVGGIVGFTTEPAPYVTIDGCSVENMNISGIYGVGGLAGIAHSGVTISNATVSKVTVTSDQTGYNDTNREGNVGLIAGACQGNATNPTVFENVSVIETTGSITNEEGTTEIDNIFGSSMLGVSAVTNYVAKIGTELYTDLQEAIDAAQDNDTIVIISDVYLTAPVEISGKTLTLDLDTYTIEDKSAEVLSADDDIWGLIVLKNNANLTICGTGTIKCNYTNVTDGWTGMAYGIDVDKTSTLTVNGGNFVNGNGGIQTRGTVVVNDGTFVSHNGGTCIMALYSDANVTVNGGTFKDSVEAEDIYTGSGAVWSGFGATVTINGGYFDFSADPEHGNVVWTLFPAQNAIAGLGNSNNADMTVVGGTFINFNPETDVVVDYSPSAGFTFGSVVEEGYECEELADGSFGIIRAELKGEGTEEKPFLINNKADLEWFRNAVNSGTDYKGKFVKLTTGIDLENEAWTPIGTKEYPFMGTFDGAENTISNLKVEGEENQGFFGYVTKAKINNLKLNNVNVKGTDCVAAVAGQGYASTYIDNCEVTGSIKIEGLTNVGGITGKYYARVTNSVVDGNTTSSYIKGVYKEANLEGDNVGGIMGHAGENNTHSNNTVKNITIEGTRKVGGLIGTTDRATDLSGCVVENVIIKCTATEEYAADNAATTTIGGLIGNYYGNSTGGTILSSTVEKVVFEKGNATNVGAIVGGVRVAPETTTVEGVTVDDNIVVEGVTGTTNGLLVPAGTYEASADGIRYATIADAMAQATLGSTVVIYEGNYESGLNVNKSITVVGDGEVNFNGKLNVTADGAKVKGLNFNNGTSSAGYISAKDVVIEDCEVVGGNGFRSCYTSGTVTFKDSTITGSTYGIHFDGSTGGNIVIDNCTITGWTSFASTITKVTITNSKFADGNYDKLRFYQDAEITDTTFNENMSVDFGKDEVNCVIKNCIVEGDKSLTDVIYLADIAEMGVNVTIDDKTIKVPAKVTKGEDTVYCLSIQEALELANGSGTVTLTEDTAENITVKAPISTFALSRSSEFVLDLNGKTLTGYVTVDEGVTIEIKNGTIINNTTGENTISSFGNIILTDVNADGVRHIVRAKKGTVVINSGTYKYTGSENGTRHALNIGDDADPTNNIATAEIYGGTFIGPKGTVADSGSAVLVQTGSTVTVFGGEFSGGKNATLSAQEDAILNLQGGTYDQNPSQYVIEPAFAAYKNADGTYSVVADRSLELTASTDKLYEGEEVTIKIVVNGNNIAGTSWTLNWNKDYFKPHNDENLANTGSVNDSAWTEGHEVVYENGTVVKEYRFVAIAQDVEVTGKFTLGNPCATTHIESFDGTEVKAGLVNEAANVTILLREYEYTKFFDDAEVTADEASVDFDGNAHTFKVVPADSSLVNAITYKVNDVDVKEVALTEEGDYTITYKIDGKTGYADYEKTFTVKVNKANYVVEVSQYTDNTELVLVYTNAPKLRFKYDNAVMLDVKAARKDGKTYEYGNVENDGYAYVYGYVVDVANTDMITYTGDNAEVFAIDNAYVLASVDEKFDFLADINFSSTLNVQDIVTEYGVAYEHSALLANIKYQRNLLKADVDCNKVINNDDPTFVVGKVKTAMGLR